MMHWEMVRLVLERVHRSSVGRQQLSNGYWEVVASKVVLGTVGSLILLYTDSHSTWSSTWVTVAWPDSGCSWEVGWRSLLFPWDMVAVVLHQHSPLETCCGWSATVAATAAEFLVNCALSTAEL